MTIVSDLKQLRQKTIILGFGFVETFFTDRKKELKNIPKLKINLVETLENVLFTITVSSSLLTRHLAKTLAEYQLTAKPILNKEMTTILDSRKQLKPVQLVSFLTVAQQRQKKRELYNDIIGTEGLSSRSNAAQKLGLLKKSSQSAPVEGTAQNEMGNSNYKW
eukprot:CAMPEP_0175060632 /NCGR_PEP_ID=MMETSP0052_2-20121109/13132_1 /TAXON_ID=51329 ORGANISM="Polytomella parva, Strain SAG 63-3" /NCGR_SAMPLE_ID=MMETSP0052_2 /ASSEMBLY_ACC=CAM_ASM_000194 /LENGTH=162 /DNA_ID=CAMNT_0016326387 /DNA_START=59 /DNA_END=544 /DNA_ORIENTATION=-